jgi:hypothetical protein
LAHHDVDEAFRRMMEGEKCGKSVLRFGGTISEIKLIIRSMGDSSKRNSRV